MADAKEGGWKIWLVVALVVIAAGVYFYQSRNTVKSQLGNKLMYVCVETGEVFTFDRGKTRIPPLENPKTGRRTLIACSKKDGKLYVSSRDRVLLKELAGLNKVIDPETLQVRTSP